MLLQDCWIAPLPKYLLFMYKLNEANVKKRKWGKIIRILTKRSILPAPDKEKTMSQSTKLDLTSVAFKADPYPTFAWYRSSEPVYLLDSSHGQNTWLISRYADVDFVLRDERFIK